MNTNTCLNCGYSTENNFCSVCGQKTDTHRLTSKHFFFHDILHGIWHLDKGILFTLKEALIRPGQAASDYIGGKRVRYYNVFYLCLILIGLNILLSHYFDSFFNNINRNTGQSLELDEFLSHNAKILFFAFIPLFALNGWLLFKRLKFNFAEHFVVAGFAMLLILMIALLFQAVMSLYYLVNQANVINFIITFLVLLMLIVPVWVYASVSRKNFTKWAFTGRIILFYLFLGVELFIFLSTLAFIFFDGKNIEWYS